MKHWFCDKKISGGCETFFNNWNCLSWWSFLAILNARIWSTERPISLDTVVLWSKNAFKKVGRGTHCLRQVCVDNPILERNVKVSALSVSLAFSIVIILN